MNEEVLHAAWNALNDAQRTNGACNDPNDHDRETELIGAIREYEAAEDYQRYLDGKRNGK